MSQHTIYKCNGCQREIGAKVHITLMLSGGSGTGIAVPPSNHTWNTHGFDSNFLHFHDGKCAGAYFDAEIKKVTAKAPKKK